MIWTLTKSISVVGCAEVRLFEVETAMSGEEVDMVNKESLEKFSFKGRK